MLFPHLRIHQIYGANTDVGKTIFSTILCLTNAAAGNRVFYLKPVSTGSLVDSDHSHISRYRPHGSPIDPECIIRMNEPVSPHLAAQKARQVISDENLLGRMRDYFQKCAKRNNKLTGLGAVYVETAGGTLSPAPSGTTQADAYRPLRLPVVLVADSKLGGISTTLSAYETLHTRGYNIDVVLMFKDDYYQNHTYLERWFKEKNIPLTAFDPPPLRPPRNLDEKDEMNMKHYYAQTASTSDARRVVATLDMRHTDRVQTLETLPDRAASTFWYPFSQHKNIRSAQDLTVIDSAHKDVFTTAKSQPNNPSLLSPTFDGSASWWTQGIGHGNQQLAAVAANAAGRYGHVIFPLAVHEPAIELAERMLRTQGKAWASRVFFSDNGSTGMEVALKMALRKTAMLYPSGEKPDLEVLGLAGSYHGDTIGAMDACEGGVYNSAVEWYKGRGAWLETPTIGFEDGHLQLRLPWSDRQPRFSDVENAYNLSKRREGTLVERYRKHITSRIQELVSTGRRFGALVLEPLVLGAGGMKFVDPLFQAILVEVVRSSSHLLLPPTAKDATLPVIFDEVFSGLGRLGFATSTSVLGVKPDIAVYAKLLTGGLVPLAVTLASQSIFDVFIGDDKASALLHGHSYTAYPVGCAVANASLSMLEDLLRSDTFEEARREWSPSLRSMPDSERVDVAAPSSLWSRSFVKSLSTLPSINWAMSLGTVLAFEVKDTDRGSSSPTLPFFPIPLP